MLKYICTAVVLLHAVLGDSEYIGCFADKNDRDLDGYFQNNGAANNVNICVSKCKELGYQYAGLQYTRQCLCGNSYGRYGKRPERECDRNCPAKSYQKCGSIWRNSVYSTGYVAKPAPFKPEYVGCYVDKSDRDLGGYFHNNRLVNSIGVCIEKCNDLGFKYAGLQFARECLCGNSYGRYGRRSDSECDRSCTADHSQKCGSSWRNSIYKTGYVDPLQIHYVGCYEDKRNRDLDGFFRNNGAANRVEFCINQCKERGFRYAGLQFTWECFCGNSYGRYSKKPDSDCKRNCPANAAQKCGSDWRNSIYKTKVEATDPLEAKYLGCYVDKRSRDLDGYFRNNGAANKVDSCVANCKRRGFRYAGLQFTWECLCGNSYGKYGKALDSECDRNCPADSSQKCGSTWRNSVYTTGYGEKASTTGLPKFTPITTPKSTTSPDSLNGKYIGCFRDERDRDLKGYFRNNGAANKVDSCIAKCKDLGYQYAGLQFTWECLCGNSYGRYGERPDSECDRNCPADPSQKCGSTWRNSVYKTGQVVKTPTIGQPKFSPTTTPRSTASPDTLSGKYIGCFKDRRDRDLKGYFRNNGAANKVDSCIAKCKDLGYQYAGLQFTWECLCGNSYGRYGERPDSECDRNCPADPSQKCGSTWRNSVYKTGQVVKTPKFSPTTTPRSTASPDTLRGKYIGCFRDERDRDLKGYFRNNGAANKVDNCIAKCKDLGYQYAGLQFTWECLCGNSYGRYGERPDSECDRNCPADPSQKCGSTWRNSIYKTGQVAKTSSMKLPRISPTMKPRSTAYPVTTDPLRAKYLGCYRDQGERDLDGYFYNNGAANKVENCIALCEQLGFRYAGLQYTWQCFCGDSYGRYGKRPDGDCDRNCPADSSQKCGSVWKNSVYVTGYEEETATTQQPDIASTTETSDLGERGTTTVQERNNPTITATLDFAMLKDPVDYVPSPKDEPPIKAEIDDRETKHGRIEID